MESIDSLGTTNYENSRDLGRSWFNRFESLNECKKPYIISVENNIVEISVFSILFVLGFLWILFGQKFKKISSFTICFSLISGVTYLILFDKTSLAAWICGLISGGIGVIIAIISVIRIKIASTLIGLINGVNLSVLIMMLVNIFLPISKLWIVILAITCTSLINGILSFFFPSILFLLSSCSIGAITVTSSLDMFFNDLSLSSCVAWTVQAQPFNRKMCWYNWIFLGIYLILFLIGCIIQTSTKKSHHIFNDNYTEVYDDDLKNKSIKMHNFDGNHSFENTTLV